MFSPPDVPYFRGYRIAVSRTPVVKCCGHAIAPRWDLWNHSPDGFEWGYCGSGPAQLALAMLCHVGVPDDLAVRLHQDFKREVVAAFDQDEWVYTVDQVKDWVMAHPPVVVSEIGGDQ